MQSFFTVCNKTKVRQNNGGQKSGEKFTFVALFGLKKIAFICIELSLGGRDDWHQFLSLRCTLRNSFAMCWYR